MSILHSRNWLKLDATRAFLYYFTSAGTLGILPIICFYYPHLYYQLIAISSSPEDSQYIHVNFLEEDFVCEVEHYTQSATGERLFVIEVENVRYCASNRNKYTFSRIPDVPVQFKRFLIDDYSSRHGREELDEESRLLQHHYGRNVMKIPESSFLEILLRYLLSPFYLFQYFSVGIWLAEDYWTFAFVILLITLIAVYVTAQETLSNLKSLRTLAGVHGDVQRIKRGHGESGPTVELVDDSALIPGQRIVISENMDVPCDAILISGKVVVDESMLTGESVPVGKVAIDLVGLAGDENYILTRGTLVDEYIHLSDTALSVSSRSSDVGSGNIGTTEPLVQDYDIASKRAGSVLFSGTKVKATFGDECIAVVYRTGYRSAKGSLISSLLKPKNDFITFISDALWVLLAMVIFCTLLYIISAVILYNKYGATVKEIFFWYCDALTCAVPSALIASLSIATTVSIGRLKTKNIFVSDTTRVNHAGVINSVCFDKTGTLTDESLSFQGALLAATDSGRVVLEEFRPEDGPLPHLCQEIMATCHGLLLYGLSAQEGRPGGSAVGDPLEMELLRASGWRLQPSQSSRGRMVAFPPLSISTLESSGHSIIKHFEFSPDRLRAASLVQDPLGVFRYFVKGSPETIVQLCQAHTVPNNIHDDLLSLARRGLRVLAIAMREFREVSINDLLKRTQDDLESDSIRFVGLVYLSNQLKPSAHHTIDALHSAKIHTTMITGDHIFTAIAVAEECGIVSRITSTTSVGMTHARPTHAPTSSGESSSTTAEKKPHHDDRMYIIDYDAVHKSVLVIDARTEKISVDLTLSQLIFLAAQTYLQGIHHDSNFFQQTRSLTAHESRVVPTVQLAVTGRALMAIRSTIPEVFPSLVRYTRVFARTKPLEKKVIVETLMSSPEFDDLSGMVLGSNGADEPVRTSRNNTYGSLAAADETVGLLQDQGRRPMTTRPSSQPLRPVASTWSSEEQEILFTSMDVVFCGDGANDMIALRAATVGVSLCDAQTSVAAPITSQRPTPYAVVEVIREGRCSLITAYVLILFNIMYATIQLYFTNTSYFFGMQASAWSFLVQDLFFGLILGVAISYTEPTSTLSATMPPKRFIKFYLLFRLVANLALFVVFQNIALYIVTTQSFYDTAETDDPFGESYGYPTAVGQHMALGQIMIASVVCSIGHPFREAWHTNIYHVCALLVQLLWLIFQLFNENNWFLKNVLKLKPFPVYFGFVILLLLVVNLLACLGATELGDYYYLQSTNRRWYEITKLSDIKSPERGADRKKEEL